LSPDRDPDVRIAIEHSIKMLSRYTVVLFVSVALVFGWGLYGAHQQRDDLAEATDRMDRALCAFVADLERRVETTVRYLDRHDRSEMPEGITRQDLRRSIANQRMTLESLSALDCR
jgi:hypothetical protein